jgi:hypothetical protein
MSDLAKALKQPQNWSLVAIRFAAAIAAIFVAISPLTPPLTDGQGPALRWAVGLLGAFIALNLILELLALALWNEQNAEAGAKEGSAPFRETAGVLVSTPGVILGLLAVFGAARLQAVPVKVAAVSLTVAVLFGIVYYSLNAWPGATEGLFATVPRFVYHVALWALALGLLCVAMSIVFTA